MSFRSRSSNTFVFLQLYMRVNLPCVTLQLYRFFIESATSDGSGAAPLLTVIREDRSYFSFNEVFANNRSNGGTAEKRVTYTRETNEITECRRRQTFRSRLRHLVFFDIREECIEVESDIQHVTQALIERCKRN